MHIPGNLQCVTAAVESHFVSSYIHLLFTKNGSNYNISKNYITRIYTQ